MSDGTAAAPQPLAPPEQVLTLEAPAAPAPVAATAAPKMAPQVPAEAIPGLDARVDTFMDALTKAAPKSPEFAKRVGLGGCELLGSSPAEFAARISAETARFAKIVQEGKIQVE